MALGIEAGFLTHREVSLEKLEANVPLVHTINIVCCIVWVVGDKFFPFRRIGIVKVISTIQNQKQAYFLSFLDVPNAYTTINPN